MIGASILGLPSFPCSRLTNRRESKQPPHWEFELASYRSIGFEVFGEERNGLFADGIMHDEIHMARVFLSAADVMTHAKIR
ncbi:hypothetical protein ACQUFY_24455 [Robbsia andropogonis]|uniref:hypothetical protein n=1 Tax=Robbsia andropogonis TaxID=28092 RepID=UPI003D1BE5D4